MKNVANNGIALSVMIMNTKEEKKVVFVVGEKRY